MNLIEELLDKLGVLVANGAELTRCLTQKVMIEVHTVAQRLLDMLRQHLHAPRDVELARGVVFEGARMVAYSLESRVELLERLGHKRRFKTSHRSLVIVIENVFEGLSAGDVGSLH